MKFRFIHKLFELSYKPKQIHNRFSDILLMDVKVYLHQMLRVAVLYGALRCRAATQRNSTQAVWTNRLWLLFVAVEGTTGVALWLSHGYPTVTFTLYLRRQPLYYVVNIIIPCCLLSLIAVSTFLLQPGCFERLGIGKIVLTAVMINEKKYSTQGSARNQCYCKDVRAMHNATTRTWFEARNLFVPSSTDCWAVRAKVRQKRPSRWP